MAIVACPACTTANQDRRTICRVCGVSLRQPAPAIGGRITFDVDRAAGIDGIVFSIPVLSDGRDAGITVMVSISPLMSRAPTPATRECFDDTKAIVMGALGGRRRERKV